MSFSLCVRRGHILRAVSWRGAPVATTNAPLHQSRWKSTYGQEPATERGPVQKKHSDRVEFPGAINSKFTNTLEFTAPTTMPAMPTFRVMDQNGKIIDDDYVPDMTDETLLKMYKDMLTISIMDPIYYQMQRQGRISFYMQSDGEEGITVGSSTALNANDVIFAQYREAGVLQARGFSQDEFANQLLANKLDNGKARNMPVHYGSREYNLHTISSPLATQIPHAAGAAYALKLQHLQSPETVPKRVVACYFGEGAASEGDFHGALNIAATRNCPVIFVCRNNGFAISTPTLEQYRGDGIASRGVGYGIDTIRVDGNDIFAVWEVMKQARALALSGDMKPVLIEAMSYRVGHHSTSDDSTQYRTSSEVATWKRRDNPIVRLRKYLEYKGLWDDGKEQTTAAQIKADVMAALKRAEAVKKPALRNLITDVYEQLTEEQEEQLKALKDIVQRYPTEYNVHDFDEGLEGLSVPSR